MNGTIVTGRSGRYRIRPFDVSDLESVLQVEEESFTFPWSREMFMTELERKDISRCFVAEVMHESPEYDENTVPGRPAVAGYIMCWLVAGELHITNLAVSPSHRRSGLAAALVASAIDDARAEDADWCQLEVRAANNAAKALYRKFGFRQIGVRKGYYQDGEDALVLALDLKS